MNRKLTFLKILVFLFFLVSVVNSHAAIVAGPFMNAANGNIYYLLAPTNAAAANAEAMSLGGHLATVRSLEENTWIVNTFAPLNRTNNLFIGLSDEQNEEAFTWMSGEKNTFRNWKSGEPNNSGGNEHYVEIIVRTGKWNDVPGHNHYSVAEIPLRLTNSFPAVTMQVEQEQDLQAVVEENKRLKRVIADQALQIEILKEGTSRAVTPVQQNKVP